MTQVRFGEHDRQRWGLDDEWLDFDPNDISVADLGELGDRFDFEAPDWPEVFFGQLTLDQAGDPNAVPKAPRWQRHAFVWMTLRQNGHPVSWDEAGEARIGRMALRQAPSPGKEPEAETSPSEPSEPSTTPPSSTSSD